MLHRHDDPDNAQQYQSNAQTTPKQQSINTITIISQNLCGIIFLDYYLVKSNVIERYSSNTSP